VNSVPWKQAERTEKAFTFYKNFKRFFPETKYSEQVESMHNVLLDIKNNLTPKS
jgi:outer membrane protein assembly factor BamD